MHNFKFEAVSENSLMIFSELSSLKQACASLQLLSKRLQSKLPQFITEQIPAYNSLLICFININHSQLISLIKQIIASHQQGMVITKNKSHLLPVCYHPSLAIDLEPLARQKKLSISELIHLHSNNEYQAYAIGFAPGFAYLGEVDKRIAAKRHATPRAQVPAGAVGIADRQTAIYPCPSPGGWQIIGRCPIPMFDINLSPPCPIQVGDSVQFKAISVSEYNELKHKKSNIKIGKHNER